ncbi:MAG: serine hydrolase [Dehalococcoidia bacterium]
MSGLIPLPKHPPDVPWPTNEWPVAEPPPQVDRERLDALLDEALGEPQPETTARTNDVLVVHRGRIVAERYAEGVGPNDVQRSWSAAKSMLHAAVGILVRDGRLRVDERAAVPEWQGAGDARSAITLDALLHMTAGLRFREDYVDDRVSDVIKMLFRPGADDMGGYAAAFPADAPPDTVFNYSSGASNIVSRIVREIVGSGEAYVSFLRRELFDAIGAKSVRPRLDTSGTWIASSYCDATPRDFARFGLLYLRDGVWDGTRVLPEGWVDYGRTPGPVQPDEQDRGYGAHWWLRKDDLGTFYAAGYVGQYLMLVPALDLIIVRNGDTPAERRPHVMKMFRTIIDMFRAAG